MMDSGSWSLTDELIYLLRRWYWFAVFALVGGLAGWLVGGVIPASYEAEAALSVTFTADAIYLNPDDYKNGQLAELSDFVRSDTVLIPLLEELHKTASLSAWTKQDLRAAIEPRWRNVGAWQLVARHSDSALAAKIAGAWGEEALRQINLAIQNAAAFNETDRQLSVQARNLEAVRLDLEVFRLLLREVQDWQVSPGDANRAETAALLAARLANLKTRSGTGSFLPGDAADPEAWGEAAVAGLKTEIAFQEALLETLQTDYDALGEQWLAARSEAYGLSAYLQVERSDGPAVVITQLNKKGDFTLVGAFVGVLVLLGLRFGRIILRKEEESG